VNEKESGRRQRPVLVVDDDPDHLKCALDALAEDGPVLSAVSGEEAVRIAREQKPAAIVLDVMMAGGADGFTAFRELHADPSTRAIPIIFLTDVNHVMELGFESVTIERYLGAKPDGFLEKTVSADELRRRVAVVIETKIRL